MNNMNTNEIIESAKTIVTNKTFLIGVAVGVAAGFIAHKIIGGKKHG